MEFQNKQKQRSKHHYQPKKPIDPLHLTRISMMKSKIKFTHHSTRDKSRELKHMKFQNKQKQRSRHHYHHKKSIGPLHLTGISMMKSRIKFTHHSTRDKSLIRMANAIKSKEAVGFYTNTKKTNEIRIKDKHLEEISAT